MGGMGQLRRAARGDYLLEMCFFFFFPVKQFSEHFPWNILTLEFKISAADMQGVEREELKLAAGNCMCQQQCQRGPRTRCQVTAARGSDASLCDHIEVLRAVSPQLLRPAGFVPLLLGQLGAQKDGCARPEALASLVQAPGSVGHHLAPCLGCSWKYMLERII